MTRVSAGARLHFGFGNLSLSHERLYGALGVALAEPSVVVEAAPASEVSVEVAPASDADSVATDTAAVVGDVREFATRACDLLGVDGAAITVEESLPRHAGLGSGTQLALATLAAVARSHDRAPAVRDRAPALGRGGRSGIGVAAFERGGFVLDAGHPTARFTTDRPETGSWEVPAVAARHPIPDHWRFLLVIPDADPGRSGAGEDATMRTVVEGADPALADRIAGIVSRRVLPAVAEGRAEAFGAAVAEVGRLNGNWYTDEQGGVFRPPVGDVVAALADSPAVFGAGQSSWGPAVYGVTDADHAGAARAAGEDALDAAGVGGEVRIVRGRNRGARIEE
ncbi:beta-ribofuranosylaminobenzene 5'-phosphate synthase family protein [Haloparvum sp. AD34]